MINKSRTLTIFRNYQIERRRDEIAQNGREAIAAYRAGELKAYTATEAIAALQSIMAES